MRGIRATAVAIIGTLILSALAAPAASHPVDTREEEYHVASSFVVSGIFGFGMLLCASGAGNSVSNGACFDYEDHVGDQYEMFVTDGFWSEVSYTAAVDVNGDGCVSSSCQGMPNDADYRINGCGIALSDKLPEVEDGVEPVLQVYIRLLEVDVMTNFVCGGSQGTIVANL